MELEKGQRLKKYSRERTENLPPRRITARSIEIVDVVRRYKFVPTSLIVRLVAGDMRTTERHLQNLYHQGLINRFAFPSTFYPTEFNYYLDDKRSLALLTNEKGYELEQLDVETIKHNREKRYFEVTMSREMIKKQGRLMHLHHELMISRFHFMLERACEKSKGIQKELEKQGRYNHLRKTMLDLLGDFIKERYRANYSLTVELKRLIDLNDVTVESIKTALKQADNIRREKVKQSLGRVSQILKEDSFKKPKDADGENKDKMGVSFYLVTRESGEEVLQKTYRYFPNEGEPKTTMFKMGEGAAGKCWFERVPVVCENGGDDPTFKEMRPGQKLEYASMICVPASYRRFSERKT
jgi:hypothetical protein